MSSWNPRLASPLAPRAFQLPQVVNQQQQQQQQTTNRHGFRSFSSSPSVFSRHSLFVLTVGMILGYMVIPLLLVQHLGFEDLPFLPDAVSSVHWKKSDIDQMGVNAIHYQTLASTNKYTKIQTLDRILSTDDSVKPKSSTVDKNDISENTIEIDEQTPPELPNLLEAENTDTTPKEDITIDTEKSKETEKITTKSSGDKPSSTTKDTDTNIPLTTDKDSSKSVPGFQNIQNFKEAEKRIVEERDILSRQSIPTATAPEVMVTAFLPDHHRKKILVTGGAGFVGSHLVDKLMMEGHEVIVVDNFFTGQKKNVAHWLHHPNFRYV
jgi:NAD dependent epimerase/dehydratase family